jgi:glycolate oxidase
MLLKNSITDLKKILSKEKILLNEEERFCYAEDSANIREPHEIPDIVVFAETIEDVQQVVKYANMHNIPIISRGAGTNMVGSCVCSNGGIVLNFSKMNKILEFNPDDMTMKVQPGVILADIKNMAESAGLFYPPDPANFKVSTIGGSIAQSSGGAKSFKYGTTKDYILSLKVVLADGTLLRLGSGTIKDAVGYHLNQLIIGSEGTLAIVVEAELKLIPKPEANALITAYFDSIEAAVEGVNGIIRARIFPSTIDFMDKNAIRTVEKFYPSGLKTDKECMLLIEADGFASSMETQLSRIENALREKGASDIISVFGEKEMEAVWTARRSSYGATAKLAPDVVTDDVIVPRSSLSKMVCGCRDICNKYNLQVCIVGHVGDGNVHPQIALNLENDEEYKNLMDAKSEIYALAISLGGTISAEHGIGIEKISYAEKILGNDVIEQMRKIKTLFDPSLILNPGKIFKN